MNENPYQSPTAYQPSPQKTVRRTNRWGIGAALAWSVFVALFLPAVHVLPGFLRVVLTLLCLVAAYGLVGAVRGWRHLLVLPLWLVMLALNDPIWTFPIWTSEDYRIERQQRIEKRREAMESPVSKEEVNHEGREGHEESSE